jgi:phosphoglycolate phosphatase-like HAD superfamily hydrolase
MRIVLFDIDGTLLWTNGAGRRAITRALELECGTPGPPGHRFDGKTDPQIVRELLQAAGHAGADDEERWWAVCNRYVAELERELARPGHHTKVFPGVARLLDQLEEREAVLLGLLTGNLAQGARLKLKSAGLDPDRFRVGAYGSDSPDRNALPGVAAERAANLLGRAVRAADLVVVGDTPADVLCGTSFGARVIGVGTGSYTAAQLVQAGAHQAFDDLSATERLVDAILA